MPTTVYYNDSESPIQRLLCRVDKLETKSSSLPSQTNRSGSVLTTNGVRPSWATLSTVSFSGSYSDLMDRPDFDEIMTAFVTSLPGYSGDGTKVLSDNLEWVVAGTSGNQTLTPPALSINTVGTTVNLSWSSTSGAQYTLQRDEVSSFPSPETVYQGTNTVFTDTIEESSTNFYRVRASKAGYTDSQFSPPASAVVTNTVFPYTLPLTLL